MESKPDLKLKKIDITYDKEDFFSSSSQAELDLIIDNLKNEITQKSNFLGFLKKGSIKERNIENKEKNIAIVFISIALLFFSAFIFGSERHQETVDKNNKNYNELLFKHNVESEALINEYTMTNAINTFYKEDYSKILNSVNADNSDLSNLITLKQLAVTKNIETIEDYHFMKEVLDKYMDYSDSIIKDNKIDIQDSNYKYINARYQTGEGSFKSITNKDKFLMNSSEMNSEILLNFNRLIVPSLNETTVAKEVLKIVNQEPHKFEIAMKAKNIFKKFNMNKPDSPDGKMKSYLKENKFSPEEIDKISSLYNYKDFVSIPYNYETTHNLFRFYYEKISN